MLSSSEICRLRAAPVRLAVIFFGSPAIKPLVLSKPFMPNPNNPRLGALISRLSLSPFLPKLPLVAIRFGPALRLILACSRC